MGDVNLERRVKRHLWAPEHEFFAVCAPGLEPLCADELTALGLDQVRQWPGGVSFVGKLDAAYRANLWLSTAGRVLMRLKDFRVRGWDDLVRQAAGIPWEFFLTPGAALNVQVTLRNTPLKHDGRVAEVVLEEAAARLRSLGLAEEGAEAVRPAPAGEVGAHQVQVRSVDRRATISIDTSGEHLHRRGYRLRPGQAPLREDLAAALLRLAGYDGSVPLLDAMCGAGTLAIEAGLIARRLPPGGARELALEEWPGHRSATWEHLRGKALDEAHPAAPQSIHARDIHSPSLNDAAENLARAGLAGDVVVEKADFLAAPPPEGGPGLVVINPPWGARLGSVRQAERFLEAIGVRLHDAYRGWRAGVVLYQQEWARHLGLRDTSHLVAPAGGRKVTLVAGRVE